MVELQIQNQKVITNLQNRLQTKQYTEPQIFTLAPSLVPTVTVDESLRTTTGTQVAQTYAADGLVLVFTVPANKKYTIRHIVVRVSGGTTPQIHQVCYLFYPNALYTLIWVTGASPPTELILYPLDHRLKPLDQLYIYCTRAAGNPTLTVDVVYDEEDY